MPRIAIKLSERLGRQVVPENRSGGGGAIGAELVMKADPDGHTLLFTSAAIVINPLLFKAYDPVKSFIPVAKMGDGPVVKFIEAEGLKWGKVVKEGNIKGR